MNPFQEVVLDPTKLVETMFAARMGCGSNKRKDLELMRVLRGALSMSKSTTGEETFRHNKLENKFLNKSLRVFNRNIMFTATTHNSKKRNVLQRWNLLFGKQKSMNHSIRELDDILTHAIEESNWSILIKERESDGLTWKEAQIKSREKAANPDEDEENPEGQQEETKPEETEVVLNSNDNLNRRGIPQLKLPRTVGIGKAARVIEEEKPKAKPPTPKPLTLAERSQNVTSYIERQKHVHDELIQRNVLQRVKTDLTEKDMLYRFQLRSQLPGNPVNCIATLKSAARVRAGTAESVPRRENFPISNLMNAQALPLLHRRAKSQYKDNKYIPQTTRTIPVTKDSLPALHRSKTMFV